MPNSDKPRIISESVDNQLVKSPKIREYVNSQLRFRKPFWQAIIAYRKKHGISTENELIRIATAKFIGFEYTD